MKDAKSAPTQNRLLKELSDFVSFGVISHTILVTHFIVTFQNTKIVSTHLFDAIITLMNYLPLREKILTLLFTSYMSKQTKIYIFSINMTSSLF